MRRHLFIMYWNCLFASSSFQLLNKKIIWINFTYIYIQFGICLQLQGKSSTITKHDGSTDQDNAEDRGKSTPLRSIFSALFNTALMLKTTLVLSVTWLTCTLVYYGISMNSANIRWLLLEIFLSWKRNSHGDVPISHISFYSCYFLINFDQLLSHLQHIITCFYSYRRIYSVQLLTPYCYTLSFLDILL